MDSKAIGSFLLELRKEKGLTQAEIAKLCNVSTQAVSKWERGDSIPDIEILNRLSLLYAITINEIVNGEHNVPYLDISRRTNIIGLTISILVLLSYLFTFAELRSDYNSTSWQVFVLKGYEVVFNGISGWPVYLTWFIFIVLISHLIVHIFTITKVVNKNTMIMLYLYISYTITVIISLYMIFNEIFYPFPQFIIFLCSMLSLILLIINPRKESLLDNLFDYNKLSEKNKISKGLLLDESTKETFSYKLSKIVSVLAVSFVWIEVLFLLSFIIGKVLDEYPSEYYYYPPTLFVTIIVGIGMIKMLKYTKSVYIKRVYLLYSLLSLIVPFSILLDGYLRSNLYSYQIVQVVITCAIPLLLVITSFRIKNIDISK